MRGRSLTARVLGLSYRVRVFSMAAQALRPSVDALMAAERVEVRRMAKRGGHKQEVEVDIRAMLEDLRVVEGPQGAELHYGTRVDQGRYARVRDLAAALDLARHDLQPTRLRTELAGQSPSPEA